MASPVTLAGFFFGVDCSVINGTMSAVRRWSLFLACAGPIAPGAAADDSWRLTTDDTVVTVAVHEGVPAIEQVASRQSGSNWLRAPEPETPLSGFEQEGKKIPTAWRYTSGSFDRQSGELVLRFTNAAPAAELKSIWRARPGRGPVEHWLTIENRSASPVTVGHQDSLVLGHVAVPEGEAMDAWWIKRGGSNATLQGGTLVRSVGRNSNVLLTSDPTDGASPVPWMALQVGTDRGLYVGWEFSGIGRIHLLSAPHGALPETAGPAEVGLEVGNVPEFKTDIAAGETFLVPPAFVGCYSGDIDDGSYTLHRFVIEKLVPRLPRGYAHPTLAYNLYLDGGGPKADEGSVLHSAALAKELGFETFVVDAMWFPQSGDWRWDPRRFPNGGRPIAEFVHGQGMKLGLWMAYSHGSNANDAAALDVAAHPDWFAEPQHLKVNPVSHINWHALTDLGYGPARDWAEHAAERVIAESRIDYFKTDWSPIVTKCVQTGHRHRYGVDVSYWSALGYYAVQEDLLRKFPDLICEGCSASGNIKDFGDIQRVHLIAINDTLSSLPNRQAIYDSTFAFPPAVLMDYTYENYYDTVSDAPEPYLWRSSMMNAWQIDPTNSGTWTPAQRADVKRATAIYRSWIRPILQDCEVHHILPRPDGWHWDGMFYWSAPLRRGTLYIFRPDSDQESQAVRLKGLSPAAHYRVTAEDRSSPAATYSGEALMKTGLPIRLPAKDTSDLIRLEEIQ